MPDDPETSPRSIAAISQAILSAGCLGVDPAKPVTFASGLRSPVYVDGRRLLSRPDAWRTVIEACAARIGERGIDAAVIAGVETAGIPHSSALAFHAQLPSVFVRKSPKGHGLGRRVEGGDVSGCRVLLVEDMITTGGSSLSAVEALRAEGAVVTDCLAIVSYGFAEASTRFAQAGVRLHILAPVADLVEQAAADGLIDDAAAATVRAWLADPHGWVAPA